jgi:nucleoside-diphosphate-sugar epimerase
MKRVAIVGATGAVGRTIGAALSAAGQPYRAVGRSEASLKAEFGSDPLAEVKTWNPDDPASVRAALEDIDAIVYLVGVNYWQFELHPKLMQATLDGAIAEGVDRMLLIGTVYPYGIPQTVPVRPDHPRNPHTFKGKMRKEQEDLLLAADAAGKIKCTVLRLPDFYGPNIDKCFLVSAFQAAATGGTAQLIGPIDTPHQYAFVPDVGPIVVRLLAEPRAYGHVWHFAGSGTATQREIVEKIFAEAHREPKMMVANKWMLRALGLFNPLMRELVEMNYLQTNPVILDDTALRELLGDVKATGYDDGIRETLAAAQAAAPTASVPAR